ncbi:translation initiation factor IF-2-like [Molossus molossus]|uniref:translation initiation factor IF-2-like n=1 Tax=Molossus molossus TaxID=27622 RepID=UPI0017460001|nr:translation initiation factor IF-2-like [Molossus molossus]
MRPRYAHSAFGRRGFRGSANSSWPKPENRDDSNKKDFKKEMRKRKRTAAREEGDPKEHKLDPPPWCSEPQLQASKGAGSGGRPRWRKRPQPGALGGSPGFSRAVPRVGTPGLAALSAPPGVPAPGPTARSGGRHLRAPGRSPQRSRPAATRAGRGPPSAPGGPTPTPRPGRPEAPQTGAQRRELGRLLGAGRGRGIALRGAVGGGPTAAGGHPEVGPGDPAGQGPGEQGPRLRAPSRGLAGLHSPGAPGLGIGHSWGDLGTRTGACQLPAAVNPP